MYINFTEIIGVRYLQIFLLAIGCFISTGIKTNFLYTIFLMLDGEGYQDNSYLSYECTVWSAVIALVGFSIILIKFNKRIIVVGIILFCALLNVLTPTLVTKFGWTASVFCLIAVTFGLFVVDVFIHNFMSRWVPISERACLGAVVFSGISLGPLFFQLTVTSSFQSTFGWSGIYYMHGIVAIAWSLLFLFLGANYPSEHPFISTAEVDYIESNTDPSIRTQHELPWKKMMTSLPAWALLFCICGHIWSYNVFDSYLNFYILSDVELYTKISKNIYIASYLAIALVPLAAGVLSDIFVRSNVSVGLVRKVVNTISMWGSAVSMFLLYLMKTKNETALIFFVIAVRGLNFGVNCGYMLSAMDLSPNFAGTLFGIVYAVATVYSYLMVKISGSFIQNEAAILYIAIVTSLVANGLFTIFGKNENQQWEKSTTDSPTYRNSTTQMNQRNSKIA